MIESLIETLSAYPVIGSILAILGIVMIAAQTIVAITPSPKDDKFLAKIKKIPYLGKILQIATSFAPIQKTPNKK